MENAQGGGKISLEDLDNRINVLQEKVEQLGRRLTRLEQGGMTASPSVAEHPAARQHVVPQENVIARVDQGALLPRIATVCFLLVVALILRTITDNQIVSTRLGSLLGLAYAVALVGVGWLLYERQSKLSPVFSACGMLLLFSVVLETHSRFAFLSAFWAYVVLLIAAGSAVWLSIRYRAAMLICLGTLGTAAVGLSIDFPYPLFPMLGLLLLVANIASFLAYRRRMCLFLRYVALAFTAVFWLLWAFKLNIPAAVDEPTASLLSLSWYFPLLFFFWFLYLLLVLSNTLKSDLTLGFYEGILPTISAVGAFTAGLAVLWTWYAEWIVLFGLTVMVLALLHFILAWMLAVRDREGATGSNAFTFAGVCLLILGLAVSVSNTVWVLPVWSALGLLLAYLSDRWHSGGVRVTAYLVQVVTILYGGAAGSFAVASPHPAAGGLAALLITVFCLQQYRWSRRHRPAAVHSAYFSWLDKKDISAVAVLVAGLVSSFFFARLALFLVLSRTMAEYGAALQSGQSVAVNAGAVLLMLSALRNRNIEIVILACIVALFGAFRVFLLDLFGIKGLPLVISVFSSGIVAAVGSVVMGRWQRKTAA